MEDQSLRDNAIRIAVTVAAGIGVLGFLVLVGGAVFWQRFSSVGLPSDEAVADLSRSQLLVMGIRQVFPFLIVLAVEVLVLYEVEAAARGTLTRGPLRRFSQYARREDTPDHKTWVLIVRTVLTVGAVMLAVGVHASLAARNTVLSVLVIAAVAAVLGVATILLAGRSTFPRFLSAALMATGIFALASSASRTAAVPEVRPAAFVIDGKPIGGLYISASGDEVYVGEVCEDGPHSEIGNPGTGLLLDFPRKDVTAILIGNNAPLNTTINREGQLLQSLVNLGDAAQSAVTAAKPKPLNGHPDWFCAGPTR
ncbi:MAG: hypothetical protein ACLP8S_04500 [Solirubrobacteraceae bacterium]